MQRNGLKTTLDGQRREYYISVNAALQHLEGTYADPYQSPQWALASVVVD